MRARVLLILVGLVVWTAPVWADSVAVPGVSNFHQVNEHVYRGAQPEKQAWDSLAKLGIKVVIDLRPEGEGSRNAEERAVKAAGMRYVNVPLRGIGAPPDEKVARILEILDADSESPVFVHCRRGADRSGTVIACYRIQHDHWSNEHALAEALSYGMSWLESGMQHYILNFHPPR